MSDLKWNKKKHDENLRKEEALKQRHRVLKIAGDIYGRWKRSLCSKPRTQKEILTGLYELRDAVGKAVDKEGLSDWRDFTMNIISDKIAQLVTAQIAETNRITEYIPKFSACKPHEAEFRGRDEFEEIPFIKNFTKAEGFVGFARQFPEVYALYDDGETLLVGKSTTEIGLTDFPTMAELQSEMGKALLPKANNN